MNSVNSYGVPPLPTDLYQKKRSIAIVWTILLLVTSILPEAFYFGLRYSSKTTTEIALTVPTAILGIFSVATIGMRTFKLLRKGSTRRPIGGKWWAVSHEFYQNRTVD
jgi:hypothetical protein